MPVTRVCGSGSGTVANPGYEPQFLNHGVIEFDVGFGHVFVERTEFFLSLIVVGLEFSNCYRGKCITVTLNIKYILAEQSEAEKSDFS